MPTAQRNIAEEMAELNAAIPDAGSGVGKFTQYLLEVTGSKSSAAEEVAQLRAAAVDAGAGALTQHVWEVIGGAEKGGIIVREGRTTTSLKLDELLSTGSLVKDFIVDGNRLLYELVTGAGPSYGWISIRLKDKELVVRREPAAAVRDTPPEIPPGKDSAHAAPARACRELESTPPSSACKEPVTAAPASACKEPAPRCPKSSEDEGTAGCPAHLVRLHVERPAALPAPAEKITRVCVLGAFHTCTNALMRELERFFSVRVANKHRSDNPTFWKHKVFKQKTVIPDGTYCVCLVKDPAFWIQSMGRSPCEGTFYEMMPAKVVNVTGASMAKIEVQPASHRSQLFGPVYFEDTLYPDALAVWEATVQGYFREDIFPPSRTAVVRCEDFLYSMNDVLDALAGRGLPRRRDAPAVARPMEDTAKDSTHPQCTRRGRNELLAYYKDPIRRYANLTGPQIARTQSVNARLKGILGYDENAVTSWLPKA